jgi:hypothetical protein
MLKIHWEFDGNTMKTLCEHFENKRSQTRPPFPQKKKILTPRVHATSLHWLQEIFCMFKFFVIFGLA